MHYLVSFYPFISFYLFFSGLKPSFRLPCEGNLAKIDNFLALDLDSQFPSLLFALHYVMVHHLIQW